MKRFRGGLVFKAHRLFYRSTLGSGLMTKRRDERGGGVLRRRARRGASLMPTSKTPPGAFRFGGWVWGSGFGSWEAGFGVWDLWVGAGGLGFGVLGLGSSKCWGVAEPRS